MAPVAAALLVALAAAAPAGPISAAEEAQARRAVLAALVLARKGDAAAKAGELPAGANAVQRFAASYAMADEEEAWARMRQLQKEAPKLPWGELGMARLYARWGLRDQAGPAFARALQLAPALSISLLERAIGERRFGQRDQALSDVQAVLAADPRDARALLLLARLEEDAGAEIGKRKERYAQVLASAPELFEAVIALARIADQEGTRQPARVFWERAGELAPQDPEVLRRLAAIREEQGDHDGAAKALAGLLAQSRGGQDELKRLAALQKQLGNHDEEERLLRRLRRLDPADRAPLVRLLELHRSKGDGAAVDDDLRALLQLDPGDAGAHLLSAARRAKGGDLVGQIDELARAERGTAYPELPEAPAQARAQWADLKSQALAPAEPLRAGSVKKLQGLAARALDAAYAERRKAEPLLRGRLKLKLRISQKGEVTSAELAEDTLGDPQLAACALLSLRDARVDPGAAGVFSLTFDLAPQEPRR